MNFSRTINITSLTEAQRQEWTDGIVQQCKLRKKRERMEEESATDKDETSGRI